MIITASINVTRFAKRGLPHTQCYDYNFSGIQLRYNSENYTILYTKLVLSIIASTYRAGATSTAMAVPLFQQDFFSA